MASNRLLEWLESGRIVLGDGAMGSVLQAAGLTPGESPELWNVTKPDVIRGVYRAYLDAGAQVIETNTFGGNAARLGHNDLQGRVGELNEAGAKLARLEAEGRDCLVAGSVGPTGEMLEPYGLVSVDDAAAMFAEQVAGLLAGGVDHIQIETMSQMAEVEAAILGARQASADVPIAVTMTFDRLARTMMGDTPKSALEAIYGWGVRAIGGNCGNGPDEIRTVMAQMLEHRPADVYLIAQSNAGLPKMVDGKVTYDGTPEVMAKYAVELYEMGVNYIGACCGSTPAHIAAMRDALVAAGAI
jgi:5-methyltetrahydrofolate--homocysteine methyltransferase